MEYVKTHTVAAVSSDFSRNILYTHDTTGSGNEFDQIPVLRQEQGCEATPSIRARLY